MCRQVMYCTSGEKQYKGTTRHKHLDAEEIVGIAGDVTIWGRYGVLYGSWESQTGRTRSCVTVRFHLAKFRKSPKRYTETLPRMDQFWSVFRPSARVSSLVRLFVFVIR